MFMLLGNHEQMCLDTLGPNSVYGSRRLWQENGGISTYRDLLYVCSPTGAKQDHTFPEYAAGSFRC